MQLNKTLFRIFVEAAIGAAPIDIDDALCFRDLRVKGVVN
jgi:hypothetical protein